MLICHVERSLAVDGHAIGAADSLGYLTYLRSTEPDQVVDADDAVGVACHIQPGMLRVCMRPDGVRSRLDEALRRRERRLSGSRASAATNKEGGGEQNGVANHFEPSQEASWLAGEVGTYGTPPALNATL